MALNARACGDGGSWFVSEARFRISGSSVSQDGLVSASAPAAEKCLLCARGSAVWDCPDNVSECGFCSLTLPFCLLFLCQAEGPVVTYQYECHGCVHPISTVPADLDPVLRHAIQHFNNHTNHSHLFTLKEVKRAQRQVVSGWDYEVTYLIQQTNCSKENFKVLTLDCKVLPNGETGECTDLAYMDPQLRIASFSQKCEILPGEDFTIGCLGCPSEIPVDSPRLKEALTHSITKLNAENNATFYFKIDIVHRATSQVVAGTKYFIEFTARETTCSKESNKELTESCETNKLGEMLRCTAVVIVVPWENRIDSTVKCQSPGKHNVNSILLYLQKQVRPCVYKGRPREAGTEPTSAPAGALWEKPDHPKAPMRTLKRIQEI
ncbi:hypothetical protein QTO34_014615 [Cnephaeus nilssonii]|uniref:Cystatin kininogen-type domain-containing protein n=1 Tax=Cnephaeus nilssonii TaxID=3371016 RepID=A0AA40LS24_CNENI|nr:hypothetical protein QTO34_014615 [Eptesicus nilssonii]